MRLFDLIMIENVIFVKGLQLIYLCMGQECLFLLALRVVSPLDVL